MSDVLSAVESRLAAAVGEETEEDLGVLRRLDFLRFAVAAEDGAYLERVAKIPAGERAPAPTLYLPGILHWTPGPLETELRPDGLARRDAPGVADDDEVNVMHGGQDVELHAIVTEGMHVHALRRMTSAARKSGRSADFLVVQTTTRFMDSDATALATVVDTVLVVPR